MKQVQPVMPEESTEPLLYDIILERLSPLQGGQASQWIRVADEDHRWVIIPAVEMKTLKMMQASLDNTLYRWNIYIPKRSSKK